jgi:hypothetical protein
MPRHNGNSINKKNNGHNNMIRPSQERRMISDVEIEKDMYLRKAVPLTYKFLLQNYKLASNVPDLIFPQSMQGRAINGTWCEEVNNSNSAIFYYPNIAIEDIVELLGKQILGMDVNAFHNKRQNYIDNSKDYLNLLFNSVIDSNCGVSSRKKGMKPINPDGTPLFGVKLFDGTLFSNFMSVLIGAYIGGCIDSAAIRAEAGDYLGIKLHQGVSMPVHRERLIQNGYLLSDLSKLGTKDSDENHILENLIEKGIVSERNEEKYSDGYVNGYIELKKGASISDDAVFLATSLIHGIEAGLGFFILDAIDTFDKSTPRIMKYGQDENIGQSIKERYEARLGKGSFPCTKQDVFKIIYLSAVLPEFFEETPDSSHRRLVQVDNGTGMCALESHIAFVRARKEGSAHPPPMNISYRNIPSNDFYPSFSKRYDDLVKSGQIIKGYNLDNGYNHN